MEHELDNLTLNEIRDYYERICRAFQISVEQYVKEKSRRLDKETFDEWVEMAMGEWLQQAEDELELVYIKEENLLN